MGLISVASSASAWRGYEYYKSKKVKSFKQISDYEYTGEVKGSDDVYNVFLDTKHVRKSTCDCPHANGKRIICKHIVALYFEIFPKEAVNYLELVEENEREAEEYERELERKLDEIASQKAQYNYAKSQLLRGSSSKIALLSLKKSGQIEKKYAEWYGDNWRERLLPEKVRLIEEKIRIEKRKASSQIEDSVLRARLCGRPFTKRR